LLFDKKTEKPPNQPYIENGNFQDSPFRMVGFSIQGKRDMIKYQMNKTKLFALRDEVKIKKLKDLFTRCWVKFAWALAKILYPKAQFFYEEEPDSQEPGIYLSNHAGSIGPVYFTLYFKKPHRPWSIHYIFEKENVTNFIFHDFLLGLGSKCVWWTRFVAWMVSLLMPPLMAKAGAIPIFHDLRMRTTFRVSCEALENGQNIVIFPERPTKFSPFVNEMSGSYAEVGKMYFQATGKILKFYPVYVASGLRKVLVGRPIEYDPLVSVRDQMESIPKYACDSINRLAQTLPPHKIRPFLPPKWYKYYGEFLPGMKGYWNLIERKK
jgi:hypothetical protein